MTSKQTEALKLALEALESCSVGDYSTGHVIHPSFDVDAVNKAIDAVDEALAQSRSDVEQPAQQPVAWSPRLDYSGYADKRVWANGKPKQEDIEYWSKNGGGVDVAYTSPPYEATPLASQRSVKPWVGLSTDEIYDMYNEPRSDAEMVEFARAIEAKLKEKNA